MGEPTDVVTRQIERFNSGDLDGWLEFWTEDAELHDVPEVPGSGVYRGLAGIRKWADTLLDAMPDLSFELSDPVENGELVAVVTRARGKGRESGVEVDWTFTTVWGVRDGLIYYHHGYSRHDEAIAALDGPTS